MKNVIHCVHIQPFYALAGENIAIAVFYERIIPAAVSVGRHCYAALIFKQYLAAEIACGSHLLHKKMDLFFGVSEIIFSLEKLYGGGVVYFARHNEYMKASFRLFGDFAYVIELAFKNRELAGFSYIICALGSIGAKAGTLSAGKQHRRNFARTYGGKSRRLIFLPVALDVGAGERRDGRKLAQPSCRGRTVYIYIRKVYRRYLLQERRSLFIGKFVIIL